MYKKWIGVATVAACCIPLYQHLQQELKLPHLSWARLRSRTNISEQLKHLQDRAQKLGIVWERH